MSGFEIKISADDATELGEKVRGLAGLLGVSAVSEPAPEVVQQEPVEEAPKQRRTRTRKEPETIEASVVTFPPPLGADYEIPKPDPIIEILKPAAPTFTADQIKDLALAYATDAGVASGTPEGRRTAWKALCTDLGIEKLTELKVTDYPKAAAMIAARHDMLKAAELT